MLGSGHGPVSCCVVHTRHPATHVLLDHSAPLPSMRQASLLASWAEAAALEQNSIISLFLSFVFPFVLLFVVVVHLNMYLELHFVRTFPSLLTSWLTEVFTDF